MEELEELKKWIKLGFESKPVIQSIINKIDSMILESKKKEVKVLVNPFHKLNNDAKNN